MLRSLNTNVNEDMDSKQQYDQKLIDKYEEHEEINDIYSRGKGMSPARFKALGSALDTFQLLPFIAPVILKQKLIAKKFRAEEHVSFNSLYSIHITEYFPVEGVIYPRFGTACRFNTNDELEKQRKEKLKQSVENILREPQMKVAFLNPKVLQDLGLRPSGDGLSEQLIQKCLEIGVEALDLELQEVLYDTYGSNRLIPDDWDLILSPFRNTVHFALNHMANAHGGHSGWSEDSFVIVDKAVNSAHQFVGGYIEDQFTIGQYRLSKDAVVFVNNAKYKKDTKLQVEVLALPSYITVVFYDGHYRDAVSNWLKESYIPILQCQEYLKGASAQDVMYVSHSTHKELFDSEVIDKHFNIRYTDHHITPMSSITGLLYDGRICTQKPFLVNIMEYNNIAPDRNIRDEVKVINELIKKMFKIPECNQDAFKMQCTAVYKVIDFLTTSKFQVELRSKIQINTSFLKYFDHFPDFSREVKDHYVTKCMQEYSGIEFKCFYQQSGKTLVDVVFQNDKLSSTQLENLAHKLSSIFNVEFFMQEQQEKEKYIVTKHVNKKENGEKIYKSMNWGKAQEVQKGLAF